MLGIHIYYPHVGQILVIGVSTMEQTKALDSMRRFTSYSATLEPSCNGISIPYTGKTMRCWV
jgi:hypothetical protein